MSLKLQDDLKAPVHVDVKRLPTKIKPKTYSLIRKSNRLCRGEECGCPLVQRPGESDDMFRHRHFCVGCQEHRGNGRHLDVLEEG